MTKSLKQPRKKSPGVELVPDAWPRFERFIKQVAKAGPQHRAPQKKTGRNKSKG